MIKKANYNSLDEILEIELISFSQPWSKAQFINDISNNKTSFNLIYVKDNKTIGYLFGDCIDNEFHLNNIAIHPNNRRNNIASELLCFTINEMRLKKINKILLEVSNKNVNAIKLYRSHYFHEVGMRKNYYSKGNDALLFNLELKNHG